MAPSLTTQHSSGWFLSPEAHSQHFSPFQTLLFLFTANPLIPHLNSPPHILQSLAVLPHPLQQTDNAILRENRETLILFWSFLDLGLWIEPEARWEGEQWWGEVGGKQLRRDRNANLMALHRLFIPQKVPAQLGGRAVRAARCAILTLLSARAAQAAFGQQMRWDIIAFLCSQDAPQ